MTKIIVQGVDVDVTKSMREQAQSIFEKVFLRYPPIDHELAVSRTPKGIRLVINYRDDFAKRTASGEYVDFYQGLRPLRASLLRQLEKEHERAKENH